VVDPDTQRQAVVTSLLSQRDHRVKLAGRGDHAAQMLREAPVDLIVLELELPDGRGEELVRRLRRDMGLETPVIVLTAQITRDSIALLKSEGVTAFVTRSSDYEFRLMSEVQAVLGGGPPQQSAAADPPDAAGDDWAADL